MDNSKLKSVIESLLFSKGAPMSLVQLARFSGAKKSDVSKAMKDLEVNYSESDRGIALIKNGNSFQLVTKPENASYIENIIKKDLEDSLSRAALEVVSIIAYRGPITRPDIEAIRGVNSSFTLRNLFMRGLITRVAKKNDKRIYLYRISFDFIKKLGLSKIEELPNYEKLSKDGRVESIINIKSEK